MDDFKDPEVQIEDLGAPEKGFGFFLFSAKDKWSHVLRLKATSIVLLCLVCLTTLFLLPGSALISPVGYTSHFPPAHSQPKPLCFYVSVDSTTGHVVGATSRDTINIIDPCDDVLPIRNNP